VYTLDFYCHEARLCLEVDGDQHSLTEARDAARDQFLAQRGILTLRFSAVDCFFNAVVVAEGIRLACIERSGRDPSC